MHKKQQTMLGKVTARRTGILIILMDDGKTSWNLKISQIDARVTSSENNTDEHEHSQGFETHGIFFGLFSSLLLQLCREFSKIPF